LDANGAPCGFATPSRKVELYSQTLLEHGYPALPEFVEPPIGPVARRDLAARFRLILTSAKPTLFCQTQHRALASLRNRAPHPEIELHPAATLSRRIANGEWVAIEPLLSRARPQRRDRPTRLIRIEGRTSRGSAAPPTKPV
jgi:anaerobic selenocysteine-containing dehydrogenase